MDPAQVGDAPVGQPAGASLLRAPRPERADIAGRASQRRGERGPADVEIVGDHDHVVQDGKLGQGGGARGAVAGSRMPTQHVRHRLERLGDRTGADDHQFGHGPQSGHRGVSDDRRVAHAAPEQTRHVFARRRDRLRGEHRGGHHVIAVQSSDQANRLTVTKPLPELSRQIGGRHDQHARTAAAGQARRQRIDLAHAQVNDPAADAATDQGSDLGVERTAHQRTDPAAARRYRRRFGPIARTESTSLEYPRHVHPGIGTKGICDAQRDLVHVPRLNRRSGLAQRQRRWVRDGDLGADLGREPGEPILGLGSRTC